MRGPLAAMRCTQAAAHSKSDAALTSAVRLLLQGADPTARDGESRTPLHHAVMRGHLVVVDLLLARGGPALLLAKDILGCTPVHLAAVQNQVRRLPGVLWGGHAAPSGLVRSAPTCLFCVCLPLGAEPSTTAAVAAGHPDHPAGGGATAG